MKIYALGALRPELERPSESRSLDVASLVAFLELESSDASSELDSFADDLLGADFLDTVLLVLLFFAGLARPVDFLVLDDRGVFLAITAPFRDDRVQPSVAPRARPPT